MRKSSQLHSLYAFPTLLEGGRKGIKWGKVGNCLSHSATSSRVKVNSVKSKWKHMYYIRCQAICLSTIHTFLLIILCYILKWVVSKCYILMTMITLWWLQLRWSTESSARNTQESLRGRKSDFETCTDDGKLIPIIFTRALFLPNPAQRQNSNRLSLPRKVDPSQNI